MIKDDLPPELFTALKGQRVLLENLMMNILSEKSSGWIDDKTNGNRNFRRHCNSLV
jgi:penicillin G amidase